jgi:dipeptidyl aminopeptidase/acylaminoacyl peptidase
VQAVACFFPPTDFLNYGKPGVNWLDLPKLEQFRAAFDFQELDPKSGVFLRVEQRSRIEELEKSVSPIYFITRDDPPTLIAHGDADVLVPLEQSQRVIDKLKDLGVPAELIVKKGGNHGWADGNVELEKFADWFDKYLASDADRRNDGKGDR